MSLRPLLEIALEDERFVSLARSIGERAPAPIRVSAYLRPYVLAALAEAGVPLDLGRTVRTATRDQRRLLRVLYRTCGWHGCTVRFDRCRIHHVVPWSNGARRTWPISSRCALTITMWCTRAAGR